MDNETCTECNYKCAKVIFQFNSLSKIHSWFTVSVTIFNVDYQEFSNEERYPVYQIIQIRNAAFAQIRVRYINYLTYYTSKNTKYSSLKNTLTTFSICILRVYLINTSLQEISFPTHYCYLHIRVNINPEYRINTFHWLYTDIC